MIERRWHRIYSEDISVIQGISVPTSGLIVFACHFRQFLLCISQALIGVKDRDGCDGGGREPLNGRLCSHIDAAKYL